MIALALALAVTGRAHAAAPQWGPWGDAWAPVDGVAATAPPPAPRKGLYEALYRWYHTTQTVKDGAKCPYYPTCSGYAILSVREYGPVLGGLYTLDRLQREYPHMDRVDHYPLVTPHETPRLYDPPPVRKRDRDDDGEGG